MSTGEQGSTRKPKKESRTALDWMNGLVPAVTACASKPTSAWGYLPEFYNFQKSASITVLAFPSQRQPHGKGAALTEFTFHGDASIVAQHHPVGNRQPQSKSFLIVVNELSTRFFSPIKTFEDVCKAYSN